MAKFSEMEYTSKSEVQSIISELDESPITVENYKKVIDKISNSERVIVGQLENFVGIYNDLMRKLNQYKETENFKRAESEGFVPKDIYEIQQDVIKVLSDSYSWKSMAAEMNKIFFKKISVVLEDIHALDIKKGTLEEMREMETRRNENQLKQIERVAQMVEEIVNHRISMIDEKLINTVKFIEQESRNDRHSMMNVLIENINVSKLEKDKLLDLLKTSNAEGVTKKEKIKEFINKPIPKLTPHQYKDIDEEEDDKDSNPFKLDDDDDILDDEEDEQ